MKHAFRLRHGEDLRQGIDEYVRRHGIRAGVITACAGSLSRWQLRCADGKTVHAGAEHCEIVSLTGTVSVNGCHLHMSLARVDMSVFGGHLQAGCLVNTTAEIVVEELEDVVFTREYDEQTGYNELCIRREKRQ